MAKTIGILGGTFDPIHHGHLRAAIECREQLDLDEVRMIPLYHPGHRQQTIADPDHRLAMLQHAVSGIDGLKVDTCELERGGVSYTIDTLIHLRKHHARTSLCLIMGADAFSQINTWHRWQELLDHANFVVVHRPGQPDETGQVEIRQLSEQHMVNERAILHKQSFGNIYRLEIPVLDISASRLRDIFKNNRDPAGLLPLAVIEYIRQHRLYNSNRT